MASASESPATESWLLAHRKPSKPLTTSQSPPFTLHLSGSPSGNQYELTLVVLDEDGKLVDRLASKVPSEAIRGNVAVVNNFDAKTKKGAGAKYRFSNWNVSGDAFTIRPERAFGPILWSMYSLSDSRGDEGFVLKMNAAHGTAGRERI